MLNEDIRLAFNPLGGSLVILTPFYNMLVGKALDG